eukprot:m.277599 g.277599  ORF g.277599 m.277599 type:complete len:1768 (+) comp15730_c0_seq1:122-5425(+)
MQLFQPGVLSLVVLAVCCVAPFTAAAACDNSCGASEYRTANCTDPIPVQLLDSEDHATSDAIELEGGWQILETASIPTATTRGNSFYYLNFVSDEGTIKWKFDVPRPTDYNVSTTYFYFGSGSNPAYGAVPFRIYVDDVLVDEPTVNQKAFLTATTSQYVGTYSVTSHIEVWVYCKPSLGGSTLSVSVSGDAAIVQAADPAEAAGSAVQCADLRECNGAEYQSVAPTVESDRECEPLTQCNATQYISRNETATTDRECTNCTVCTSGQVLVSNCTTYQNTDCFTIVDDYEYSEWSEWSVSCGSQARFRNESCPAIACLESSKEATTQFREANGGCQDLCSIEADAVVCGCQDTSGDPEKPTYLLPNGINCTNTYCTVSDGNASVATTFVEIGDTVDITCASGYGANGTTTTTYPVSCSDGPVLSAFSSCQDIDECAGSHGCANGCVNSEGTFCCREVIDYEYTEWSDWSATCENATRTRVESCNAGCDGFCINQEPTLEMTNLGCCPGVADFTYGPYPDFNATCDNQTRYRPEICNAPCNGTCINSIDTADTLVNGGCQEQCLIENDQIQCACESGKVLLGDGTSCSSFDVCRVNNGGCDTFCVDDGSGQAICSCENGYALVNGTTCVDVNECDDPSLNNCMQQCVNQDGSYTCDCYEGYDINPANASTCLASACEEEPPLILFDSFGNATASFASSNISALSPNSTTFSYLSTATYNCSTGYSSDGAATSATTVQLSCNSTLQYDPTELQGCLDVNECLNNPCDHTCANTEGSFICSCDQGYEVDPADRLACVPAACKQSPPTVLLDMFGNTTASLVEITLSPQAPASDFTFLSTATYNCTSGYSADGLATGNSSITLACNSSLDYDPATLQGCLDVDECLNNPCSHFCNNTQGDYECSCPSGLELANKTTCIDVDECLGDPCEQACINTYRSFYCSCDGGFMLNGDNITCSRVPCASPPLHLNNATRTSNDSLVFESIVTYKCWDGFSIDGTPRNDTFSGQCMEDGMVDPVTSVFGCVEIDECAFGVDECQQQCINTVGSYECDCFSGYELNGTFSCADVNECDEGTDDCATTLSNSVCRNTIGAFACDCKRGYVGADCSPTSFDLLNVTNKHSMNASTQSFLPWVFVNNGMYQTVGLELADDVFVNFELSLAPGTMSAKLMTFIYSPTSSLVVAYNNGSLEFTRDFLMDKLDAPALSDGKPHRITINFSAGNAVAVLIDGMPRQTSTALKLWAAGAETTVLLGGEGFVGFVRRAQVTSGSTASHADLVSNPQAFDLLGDVETYGTVQDTNDGLRFAASGLLAPNANVSATEFTKFTMTATYLQEQGTSSYVLAFADDSFSVGFYTSALLDQSFLVFTLANGTVTRVSIPSLSDGLYHRLLLAVNGDQYWVRIDGMLRASGTFPESFSYCPNCTIKIGGSPDVSSTDRIFASTLQGLVASAWFFADLAMTADVLPYPPALQLSNDMLLLDDDAELRYFAAESTIEAKPFLDGDGDLASNGGFRLTNGRFVFGTTFSLFASFLAEPNALGYLFSITDGNATHYLSVYLSNRDWITLRITLDDEVHRVVFRLFEPITQGAVHQVLLTAQYLPAQQSTQLSLYVDSKNASVLFPIPGAFSWCGAPSNECYMAVGSKAVYNATLVPEAINNVDFVAPLDPLLFTLRMYPNTTLNATTTPNTGCFESRFFLSKAASYIPGRNQLGSYLEGVSLDECACMCLADSQCKSFEAGVETLSQEGVCYLSTDTRSSIAPEPLAPSPLFTYYEKRV